MEKILVSIIVPIYNTEKYLKRCIDSIVNQTYKNIEIILVDDESTDNSCRVCDEYASLDNRIKVIHKKNGGVASARNKGLDISKGEYICFVDSDDWIEKNMIEIMLKEIVKNRNGIVRCNTYELDNKPKKEWINKKEPVIDNVLNGNISAYVYLLMIKSDIIKKIRFDEKMIVLEDTYFLLELLVKYKEKIIFLDDRLYHYEMNNEGLTLSSKNARNKIIGLIEYKEKAEELLKENNLYTKEREVLINTVIANFIIYYIYKLWAEKQEVKSLINNPKIIKILENVNTQKMSTFTKIQIKNITEKRIIRFRVMNLIKKYIKG